MSEALTSDTLLILLSPVTAHVLACPLPSTNDKILYHSSSLLCLLICYNIMKVVNIFQHLAWPNQMSKLSNVLDFHLWLYSTLIFCNFYDSPFFKIGFIFLPIHWFYLLSPFSKLVLSFCPFIGFIFWALFQSWFNLCAPFITCALACPQDWPMGWET